MVPYLRAANVKDGELDLSSVYEMNFTPNEQRLFALRPGDVLVTEGSGSIGAVGASAVWSGEMDDTVCFQNTLLRLRPRPGTDARFLAWWCRHAFADGLFASVASGANIYHLSAERVRGIAMADVPVGQQRAIADYLDAETTRIDALVTKKQRLIDRLEERSARVLNGLAVGPFVPLRRVATVHGGVTVDSGRASAGSIRRPYLRVANVQDGWLDLQEVAEIDVPSDAARRAILRAGDVLMTEANGNPSNLGRGAMWTGQIENCLHQNHVFAIRTDPALFDPRLLTLLTQSPHGREYFRAVSSQVGIATISSSKILDFPVPRLALDDQRALIDAATAELTSHRALTDRLERQIELLREHRQALITAAVTGEFQVPGAA